jgi:hypothetical protein
MMAHTVRVGTLWGVTFTITAKADRHRSLEDDGDWFGKLTDKRVDGSSHKVPTDRSGSVWWTPPKDVKEPEAVAALKRFVADAVSGARACLDVTATVSIDGTVFKGVAHLGGIWEEDTTAATEALLRETVEEHGMFDEAFTDLRKTLERAVLHGQIARGALTGWTSCEL